MHGTTSGKHHLTSSPRTSTTDELSPLAGTVGIELVPQTLALTAGSYINSASATEQQAAGADTAQTPAEEEQQPRGGSQEDASADSLAGEGSVLHQQSGETSHVSHGGRPVDIPGRASEQGQASPAVESTHTSQQHNEQQQQRDSHGPYGQQDSAHDDDDDDEHAVLIAASESQPRDGVFEQAKVPNSTMSKKPSAASERQRVWYKERAVQLTILG